MMVAEIGRKHILLQNLQYRIHPGSTSTNRASGPRAAARGHTHETCSLSLSLSSSPPCVCAAEKRRDSLPNAAVDGLRGTSQSHRTTLPFGRHHWLRRATQSIGALPVAGPLDPVFEPAQLWTPHPVTFREQGTPSSRASAPFLSGCALLWGVPPFQEAGSPRGPLVAAWVDRPTWPAQGTTPRHEANERQGSVAAIVRCARARAKKQLLSVCVMRTKRASPRRKFQFGTKQGSSRECTVCCRRNTQKRASETQSQVSPKAIEPIEPIEPENLPLAASCGIILHWIQDRMRSIVRCCCCCCCVVLWRESEKGAGRQEERPLCCLCETMRCAV